MRDLALLITAFSTLFTSLLALARDFEGVPESKIEEIYITTEDGAAQKLIHLRNPGKPILLLEPGLGAQGLSLQLTATALFQRGEYDIFIGNWRGSAKLPDGLPMLSASGRDGLEQVIRKDFPSHLRYLIQDYATPEQLKHGISVLGHSMGGMMIMGTLSDPKLHAEFKPHLRSIVLFQSPHHLRYLKAQMRVFAKVGLPAIRYLRNSGIETIDMHSKMLERTKMAKEQGGVKGKMMAAVENFAIALTRFALSPAHTGRHMIRRVFFKMPAYSIPMDLMEDFARAVLEGGEFYDSRGERLIRPEAVRDLPVLVVRSKLDTLAPWKQQGEYFEAIGSYRKQLLNLPEMNHIDAVLFTRPELDFLDHVVDFVRSPERVLAQGRRVNFKPKCESLLTRVGLKLRFRGI